MPPAAGQRGGLHPVPGPLCILVAFGLGLGTARGSVCPRTRLLRQSEGCSAPGTWDASVPGPIGPPVPLPAPFPSHSASVLGLMVRGSVSPHPGTVREQEGFLASGLGRSPPPPSLACTSSAAVWTRPWRGDYRCGASAAVSRTGPGLRAPLTRGQGQVGAERLPKVAPGRVGGGVTCSGLRKLGSGARRHGLGSPWIRTASVASQQQVPFA
jgi:hypothetical protein